MLYAYGEANAREDVWMSHGDSVVQLPPGFSVVAKSDQVLHFFVLCPSAGMVPRWRYGCQVLTVALTVAHSCCIIVVMHQWCCDLNMKPSVLS